MFGGGALGGVALEEFIGHDSQQDYNAENAEFKVGGNAEHVDGVVNEPNHGGGNDDAQDGSYAPAQTAPAQYGSGDGVEFVKFMNFTNSTPSPLPYWAGAVCAGA